MEYDDPNLVYLLSLNILVFAALLHIIPCVWKQRRLRDTGTGTIGFRVNYQIGSRVIREEAELLHPQFIKIREHLEAIDKIVLSAPQYLRTEGEHMGLSEYDRLRAAPDYIVYNEPLMELINAVQERMKEEGPEYVNMVARNVMTFATSFLRVQRSQN